MAHGKADAYAQYRREQRVLSSGCGAGTGLNHSRGQMNVGA